MPNRAPDSPVAESAVERVLRECTRYSFYQLVRILVRSRESAVTPGGEGPVGRETVRFRPAASLGFAASDVQEIEVREDPLAEIPIRYIVTVNFMGLYGPSSPMPPHFTEEIIWAGAEGAGPRDFLDIFHHRLISLVYRAWEKYRYPIQFEGDATDRFTQRIACLAGLGTPGIAEAAGLPLLELLRVTGALGAHHRSASGLAGLLRDQFEGIPIDVEACVERDAPIPRALAMRLGRSASRLGEDACLGERVRDRSGKFRIVLGPLGPDEYRRFLPRGEDLERLARLVRLFATDPLEFDVALRLAPDGVPALRLSPEADLPLGLMSWLTPRGDAEGRALLSTRGIDPLSRGAGVPANTRPSAGTAVRPEPMTTTTRRF